MMRIEEHKQSFRHRMAEETSQAIEDARRILHDAFGEALVGAKIEYPLGDEMRPLVTYPKHATIRICIIEQKTANGSSRKFRYEVNGTPAQSFGEACVLAENAGPPRSRWQKFWEKVDSFFDFDSEP